MAWKKGPNGELVFYEDGREPVTFPRGSLTPETIAGIELETTNPEGARALSGAKAAADLGLAPPPMQPVNTIDLNAPPGPPAGQPVNTIDLNAPAPVEPGLPPEEIEARRNVASGLSTIGDIAQKGKNLPIIGGVADMIGTLAPMGAEALNATIPRAPAPDAPLPSPVTGQQQIAEVSANGPAAHARPSGPSPLGAAFREQDRAMAGEKSAIDQATEVKKARGLEESSVLGRLNSQIAGHEAKAQIQRDIVTTETAAAEKRYADAIDAAAKMKVDPEHYWSSKNSGQKFALGLAAVIGALGQALTGKDNVAIGMINKGIDQDIQLQKDAILNAKEGANLKGNIVAQMRQKGLTFEQSVNAAKQVMLEGAKRRLDALAAEYGTPEAEANATMAKAKIDKEIADMHVARTIAAQKAAGAAIGRHLNEGTAKELGDANAAVKNARSLLDKFETSHAGGFGGWLMSFVPMTDEKRYEDSARVATQIIGTYLEGGKLSDANVPQYRAMLPKAGESAETARNKINEITKQIALRQTEEKKGLAGAGFNVSGIADAKREVGFRAAQ